jgi:hypothetical protein
VLSNLRKSTILENITNFHVRSLVFRGLINKVVSNAELILKLIQFRSPKTLSCVTKHRDSLLAMAHRSQQAAEAVVSSHVKHYSVHLDITVRK